MGPGGAGPPGSLRERKNGMQQKSRSNHMFLFFVVLSAFFVAASFAHPVTPTLIKEYDLNDYMFGVALAAMQTTNFLFSPFWGKLNNYISSRQAMLVCGIGYAVGQALFGMARTEAMVIFARAFAGFFTGGAFVSFLTYVVNTSSDNDRGKNLTISATIQSVAGAFGYFVGGFLGEIGLGVTFAAQSICLAACGVFFFLFCKDDRKVGVGKLQMGDLIHDANPFAAFVQSRQFMSVLFAVLFTVTVLQNVGYNAFEQCFNYFIKDEFGLTSKYNGLIKGVIGFVSLTANATICMWMIRRTNVRRSVIYVLMACTLTSLGVVFSNAVVPFMTVSVLFYAFNAVSIPLLQDMVAKRAQNGKDSNLIMGFYNATKSLGGIIGSLSAGFLYTVNSKLTFVVTAVVFFGAVIFSTIYSKMKEPAENPEQAPASSR